MPRNDRLPYPPSDRDASIYEYRRSGETYREIAERYGISIERVRQIVNRVTSDKLILDIYGYLEVNVDEPTIHERILADYGPKYEFRIRPIIARNLRYMLEHHIISEADPRLAQYGVRPEPEESWFARFFN